MLEALAVTLGGSLGGGGDPMLAGTGSGDPMAALLPMLAPLLLGVQSGSMIGYLAQHTLGRYDLPLPTSDEPSLCFVVPNLDTFEEAWSLERADLRFTVALHEVIHTAVRSVPWVSERLVGLATDYVSAYEVDPTVLGARLGHIDPSDAEKLQQLAERPEELLGAMTSPVRPRCSPRCGASTRCSTATPTRCCAGSGNSSCRRSSGARGDPRHRLERGEATRSSSSCSA